MTSSRNPTPRPRKVAGRANDAKRAQPTGEVEPVETTAGEAPAQPDVVEPEVVDELPASAVEVSTASTDDAPARKGTIALVLAIVVLTAVALLQAAYLWGPLKDDPKVSSQRPVLVTTPVHRSAVDTAKVAVEKLTARSYQTYDEQVDEATAMMTTAFAETYRETTDQVKDEFVAAETEVTVSVEAQAVMTASDNQVEALIFLTQFTAKKGEETAFTPYRIKVTMIDTDQGWLVSDVETA